MAWEAHNGTQANRTIAAMLAGLGCVVLVIVVPGASAVPANLESAGAAHFAPWAEDLIAALNGAMPPGGARAQKPTSNFDGLISIKTACDWAKLTDTGTGEEPKYGDSPAGFGASVFLGTEPVRANQTGDVNADGCVEIVVTSPWGLGILQLTDNALTSTVMVHRRTAHEPSSTVVEFVRSIAVGIGKCPWKLRAIFYTS